MFNIAITTPCTTDMEYHRLIPDGEGTASQRAFQIPPRSRSMIEISMHDKFAKRIILASLLCGSGKVC